MNRLNFPLKMDSGEDSENHRNIYLPSPELSISEGENITPLMSGRYLRDHQHSPVTLSGTSSFHDTILSKIRGTERYRCYSFGKTSSSLLGRQYLSRENEYSYADAKVVNHADITEDGFPPDQRYSFFCPVVPEPS